MNILYIGPYRQIDYIGQVSNTHIESIKKTIAVSDKLITRPIYIDSSLSDGGKNEYESENMKVGHIDLLIQYAPVNYITISKNIKNITVPILDPKLYNISQDHTYNMLNYCDKILVDDEKNKTLLKMCGIKTNIDIYEEKIYDTDLQKFNLDQINNHYKFGFIGQYRDNKQIIQKIIQAFLIVSRIKHNIKLFLFLRGSDQDKKELLDHIQLIQAQLNIPKYIQSIQNIFGLWGLSESIIALNSIDCFISLNDDYRYLLYEKLFMSSESINQKFLISRQNTQTIEVPIVSLSNIYEYKNTLYSISTNDLCQKIANAESSSYQKNKKNHYPSFGNIICK